MSRLSELHAGIDVFVEAILSSERCLSVAERILVAESCFRAASCLECSSLRSTCLRPDASLLQVMQAGHEDISDFEIACHVVVNLQRLVDQRFVTEIEVCLFPDVLDVLDGQASLSELFLLASWSEGVRIFCEMTGMELPKFPVVVSHGHVRQRQCPNAKLKHMGAFFPEVVSFNNPSYPDNIHGVLPFAFAALATADFFELVKFINLFYIPIGNPLKTPANRRLTRLEIECVAHAYADAVRCAY